MIESGAETVLQKNNLMIKTLCRTFIFQSFNSNSVIVYDTAIFIITPGNRRCQYLILVYIINTCKERQNLHVRCENSECYFPNLHVAYANLGS